MRMQLYLQFFIKLRVQVQLRTHNCVRVNWSESKILLLLAIVIEVNKPQESKKSEN